MKDVMVVDAADGRWRVDLARVEALVRSAHLGIALDSNYGEKTLNEAQKGESWWSQANQAVFGAMLPEVKVVDIDFERLRGQVETATWSSMATYLRSDRVVGTKREALAELVDLGERKRQNYLNKARALSMRNLGEVRRAESNYGIAIEGMKFTRDASLSVLVGCVMIYTGGTAAGMSAAAGLNGLGTGAAQWLDGGNAGNVAISATVNAITTLIRIPPGAFGAASSTAVKLGTEGVAVWLELIGDFSSGVIQGKSAQEAVVNASLKQVASFGVGKALDKVGIEEGLKALVSSARGLRTPIPGRVVVGQGIRQIAGGTGAAAASAVAEAMHRKTHKVAAAPTRDTMGAWGRWRDIDMAIRRA